MVDRARYSFFCSFSIRGNTCFRPLVVGSATTTNWREALVHWVFSHKVHFFLTFLLFLDVVFVIIGAASTLSPWTCLGEWCGVSRLATGSKFDPWDRNSGSQVPYNTRVLLFCDG